MTHSLDHVLVPYSRFLECKDRRQRIAAELTRRDHPPTIDADWDALLQHYGAIHSLTPAHTTVTLAEAEAAFARAANGGPRSKRRY